MSEGRVGRSSSDIADAGLDTLTLSQSQLANRLVAVENEIRGKVRQRVLNIPTPGSPFVIVQVREKDHEIDTVKILTPPGTDEVFMGFRLSTEGPDDTKEEHWEDISEAEALAGQIERQMKHKLDYGKTYHLKYLVARGDFARRRRNPDPRDDSISLTTWNTLLAFNAPSAPAAVLILVNQLDPTTKDYDGFAVFRVYAALTDGGAAQTFREALQDSVKVVLSRTGTTEHPHKQVRLSDTELDQRDTAPPDGLGVGSPYYNRGYVDISIGGLKPGAQYTWDFNVAYTNGEKAESGGPAITFYGANLRIGTAGLPELSGVTLTATVDGDIADAKSATVTLTFTQGTPPIALRKLRLFWKKSTAGAFPADPQRTKTLHKDDYHTAGGTYSIVFTNVKIKPRKDWNLKLTIVAEGEPGGTAQTRDVTVTLDATALNDPSAPSAALIISNTLDPNTKEHDAVVVRRVHAPLTDGGAAQSWRDSQSEKVWVQHRRVSTGKTGKDGGALSETELDQLDAASTPANRGFVDIESRFKVAAFEWIANIIEGMGELHTATPGATVTFQAGGLATAGAGITELTSVSLSLNTSDPFDGKNAQLLLNFTQPATVVALRYCFIEVSTDGGGSFTQHGDQVNLKHDIHHSAGAHIVPLRTVRTKKLTSHIFRVTIVAQGGATRQVTLTQTTGDTSEGAVTPTALAFPSAPTGGNNSVDGDPEKNMARIALTLATSSGAFTANNVSLIEIVLIRRNATNTADVGNPFSEIKVLSTADLAASSAVHEFFLRMGQKFRITKVVARNGDKRTETTGTADFTSGGLLQVDTGDAKVVAAPVFASISRSDTDDNKNDDVRVTLTQDGVDIVWFKRLIIEKNVNAAGWRVEKDVPLKFHDPIYASVSASFDQTFTIKRRAGKSVQYRATAYAVGGKASATTTSGSQAATTGDVLTDTAVPTLATNPDTTTTGPTVVDWFGTIAVSAVTPSANFTTLDKYQFIQSTSNVAPAGTPTVGSEGVVKIKEGPTSHETFRVKQSQIGVTVWFYFRAHNQFGSGYSAWSAGTSVSPSRPLQDFIGDADPVWPIGLQASGTGPSAPAVANDTTHFSISTSDPLDYTALLARYSMFLHIPSLPGIDRIRKITSYDVVNHRFLVAVAFGTTPGNSLAYEVHYGLELGEKSGTGNTTTTLVLGTAGALLAAGSLIGMSVYMPSQPSADRIRRIIGHSGGAITFEDPVAGALTNNHCYGVSEGSFGFASINPLAGIVTGAPFRVWCDTDLDFNNLEVIMPIGGNAYSAQAIQIEGYKKGSGAFKTGFLGAPNVQPTYPFRSAVGFSYVWRIRIQNLFRDGSADDGWSAYTFYVEGYESGDSPSSPYDPGAFDPVVVDFQSPDSWPNDRYLVY
ncbi:MAG: hypothetical protein WBV94_21680 [Blastocatellia bacterium]